MSSALQSSTIDISESVRLITSMITSISDLRGKPSAWPDICNEVLTMCSTHDIAIEDQHSEDGKRKRTIFEKRQTIGTITQSDTETKLLRLKIFVIRSSFQVLTEFAASLNAFSRYLDWLRQCSFVRSTRDQHLEYLEKGLT